MIKDFTKRLREQWVYDLPTISYHDIALELSSKYPDMNDVHRIVEWVYKKMASKYSSPKRFNAKEDWKEETVNGRRYIETAIEILGSNIDFYDYLLQKIQVKPMIYFDYVSRKNLLYSSIYHFMACIEDLEGLFEIRIEELYFDYKYKYELYMRTGHPNDLPYINWEEFETMNNDLIIRTKNYGPPRQPSPVYVNRTFFLDQLNTDIPRPTLERFYELMKPHAIQLGRPLVSSHYGEEMLIGEYDEEVKEVKELGEEEEEYLGVSDSEEAVIPPEAQN